jgi:hypothetical protein
MMAYLPPGLFDDAGYPGPLSVNQVPYPLHIQWARSFHVHVFPKGHKMSDAVNARPLLIRMFISEYQTPTFPEKYFPTERPTTNYLQIMN